MNLCEFWDSLPFLIPSPEWFQFLWVDSTLWSYYSQSKNWQFCVFLDDRKIVQGENESLLWPGKTFACQLRLWNLKWQSLRFAIAIWMRQFSDVIHRQNCLWSWTLTICSAHWINITSRPGWFFWGLNWSLAQLVIHRSTIGKWLLLLFIEISFENFLKPLHFTSLNFSS
jgi:hypothetical protein